MKTLNNSIQAKIVLAITLTFLAVLLASALLTGRSEHHLAEEIGRQKAHEIARTYFDGVNTMMLTGTMAEKDTWRHKLLAEGNLLDLRIVHAPKHLDGVTHAPELPRDETDQRALAGETLDLSGEHEGVRTVTYVEPIRATSNHHGTNCLNCHQVPPDTVLGAVRATYSLEDLDQRLNRNLLAIVGINLALFGLGIGLLLLLLRAIVISPLLAMRGAMRQVEQDADLRLRLDIESSDEIGSLAQAINHLLERFRDSLARLAETSHRLSTAADKVAEVSEQTADAAHRQLQETESAAHLMGDLRHIVQEVGGSAGETADASVEADRQAVLSTASTREAIGGILGLVDEIEGAAKAMDKLDEQSQKVSNVLAVIRSIAEQTNLLALNAAIEAARAGDAGRGFAVVADEVRKLATLSHESTHSIKAIVEELQGEARDAAKAMDHARDSAEEHSRQLDRALDGLDQIVGRVGDIRRLTGQSAEAVSREHELAENVNQRMANVGDIAGRTADQAVRTRGVSEDLVSLARELNGLVKQFKL